MPTSIRDAIIEFHQKTPHIRGDNKNNEDRQFFNVMDSIGVKINTLEELAFALREAYAAAKIDSATKRWFRQVPRSITTKERIIAILGSKYFQNPDEIREWMIEQGVFVNGDLTEPVKEPEIERKQVDVGTNSDQPAVDDHLGFEPYVDAVTAFLTSENSEPPLTMSVEGEWGSGKSSFMRQLKKQLEDRGEFTFSFNPWKHDRSEGVWAAFAVEFLKWTSAKYKDFHPLRWLYGPNALAILRFNWREGWRDVMSASLRISLLLIISVFVLFPLFSPLAAKVVDQIAYYFSIPGTYQDTYKEMISLLIALIPSLVASIVTLHEYPQKIFSVLGLPPITNITRHIDKPDYESFLPFIERFHRDFDKMVEAYLSKGKKIFVFIDDLDRCEVPKAAELMQAINLMISDDHRLIYIMGMDREKVAAGIAVKNEKVIPYLYGKSRLNNEADEDTHIRGIEYGYSFIEKFVQLPFQVPTPDPSSLDQYIRSITTPAKTSATSSHLPDAQPSDAPESPEPAITEPKAAKELGSQKEKEEQRQRELEVYIGKDSETMHEILKMVAPALGNNPRRIKQFLNVFRLRAYIAFETGVLRTDRMTFKQLAKFVAATLQWPLLLNDAKKKPDLFGKLARWCSSDPPTEYDEEAPYWKRWNREEDLLKLLLSSTIAIDGERAHVRGMERLKMENFDVTELLRISPRVTVMRTAPEMHEKAHEQSGTVGNTEKSEPTPTPLDEPQPLERPEYEALGQEIQDQRTGNALSTHEELLSRLKGYLTPNELENIKKNLKAGAPIVLSGKNLNGIDLSRMDLRGANLATANLKDSDLTEANLGGANLRGTSFTSSNLRSANLAGANAVKARFKQAELGLSNLGGANLREAAFQLAMLRSAKCIAADLREANFSNADLTGADLEDANLVGTSFRSADLATAQFAGADLRNADLKGAYLTDADMTHVKNLTTEQIVSAELTKRARFPAYLQRDESGQEDQSDSEEGPHLA